MFILSWIALLCLLQYTNPPIRLTETWDLPYPWNTWSSSLLRWKLLHLLICTGTLAFILILIISQPSPPFLTANHPVSNAVWNFLIQIGKILISSFCMRTPLFHLFFKAKETVTISYYISLLYFLSPKTIVFLSFFPVFPILFLRFPKGNWEGCTYRQINLNRNFFVPPIPFKFYLHYYNFSETQLFDDLQRVFLF